MENYYVYILYSSRANRYYVGQTNDLSRRLSKHNSGFVSSTKPYLPWELKLSLHKSSRSEAMALERKLKNLGHARLQAFIVKYSIGPVADANE